MRIETNRQLIILNTLMKKRGEYCSSELLARQAMVSVRTIKNDVPLLNSMLKEDGSAEIVSMPSHGYRIEPDDPEKFRQLEETLHVHQILFRNRSIEEMNRRLFIIQKLLSEDSVKTDDLADELYISRSSLKNDLSWSQRFLRSHHVICRSVPGKGLIAEGEETDLRTAMVEVFCSQYHDIELLYPVEGFNAMFENTHYETLRHTMLKIIRESELTISDVAAKKIAVYLCLIPERIRKGHVITLSKTLRKELSSGMIHELSKAVFQAVPLLRKYRSYEEEILSLTRLFALNIDIDLRNPVPAELIPGHFIKESEDLFTRFITECGTNRKSRFLQSELLVSHRKDFESVLIRLIIQKAYDHTDRQYLVTYTETGENNYSPLAMEYTRVLVQYLEEEFREKIRSADIKAFSAIFHHLLKQIPFEIKKMRLAVFSTEGRTTAELMRDELLSMFGDYIEYADVFNLYEMRRIRFSDYDCAVSSWDVAYYRYPIPLVSYRGINAAEDRKKLVDELFIYCFNDETVRKMESLLRIFEHTPMNDYMTLIQQLADQYGRNPAHARKIAAQAVDRFSALSYYNPDSCISMIFLDYSDTGQEVFDVYVPNSTVYWGTDMEIHCFIVICIKPDLPVSSVKTMNHILQELFQSRELTDRLIGEKDAVLFPLFRKIIQNSIL